MRTTKGLKWRLSHSTEIDSEISNPVSASVPGAVQLDMKAAHSLPDFNIGQNVLKYNGLEDYYWHYYSELQVEKKSGKIPFLVFKSIDYKCSIYINASPVKEHEGIITPIELDLRAYEGQTINIEVIICPAPKRAGVTPYSGLGRESVDSCKPHFSYGWDWSPRLIPLGICGDAFLEYRPASHICSLDVQYKLLNQNLRAEIILNYILSDANALIEITLLKEGAVVYCAREKTGKQNNTHSFTVDNPELWWPAGQGKQNIYSLSVSILENENASDSINKTIGFRRVKLVTNEGVPYEQKPGPTTCNKAPITIEINGRRIFAKGTNWLPPELFYSEITKQKLEKLLSLVREANMNIVRIWGGGFMYHDSFYEICDQYGIMVWQEFPLSCADYPDTDEFLSVLNQESLFLIKNIRNHPCLAFWCGGNELLNDWSGMTEQSLALRLLNSNCFYNDPQTPFLPSSPVYGVGHGGYQMLCPGTADKELLTQIRESKCTAYTEFGCAAPSPWEYLQSFIPTEEIENPEYGSSWETHHALNAYGQECWLVKRQIEHFTGKCESTKQLAEKGVFLQSLMYRYLFEEMRMQRPYCSMAINWCFNEPWPTAAGNSLVNYPAIKKPAFETVKDALRDQKLSIRINRMLWEKGEIFNFEVWLLNDSPEIIPQGTVTVTANIKEQISEIGIWRFNQTEALTNQKGPSLSFTIPELSGKFFEIFLTAKERPELNAGYTVLLK